MGENILASAPRSSKRSISVSVALLFCYLLRSTFLFPGLNLLSQLLYSFVSKQVNFESVIMLENKLNRICKCLVMVKYAEEQASF